MGRSLLTLRPLRLVAAGHVVDTFLRGLDLVGPRIAPLSVLRFDRMTRRLGMLLTLDHLMFSSLAGSAFGQALVPAMVPQRLVPPFVVTFVGRA